MEPANGYEDWEVTQLLANAIGCDWNYTHPKEILAEIARLTPTFTGVSWERLDTEGSLQWPVNEKFPDGSPIMHVNGFVRGKGKFVVTDYVPTDEKTGPRFPLLLTTGRILSQYNVGAQTRRTGNVAWHPEDLLEMHPVDAEDRGLKDGDWARLASRAARRPCASSPPTAWRQASSTRPSIIRRRRPTSSPPNIRTGRPIAPSTR